MKGKCKCGKIIDEVEFTQFGICVECYKKVDATKKNDTVIVDVDTGELLEIKKGGKLTCKNL